MKKLVYTLTIVLLLLVFGVSAFFVGSYVIESREQAQKNADLAALKDSAKETVPSQAQQTDSQETVPEGTFGAEEIRDENGMLIEYSEIYAKNPDLVGWIRIDGTKLDNPVMQTPDNPNYYLDHDFSKQASDWGAIYAREECGIFEASDNITLYGHNMNDGSMFAALNAYWKNEEVVKNNPLIFFDTLYEYRVYKIFAVFKTSANLGEGFDYHNMIDASSKEEFDEFIATCKDLSYYDSGITPQYGDKVICLSTCEYDLPGNNGRLVVAAVRIS